MSENVQLLSLLVLYRLTIVVVGFAFAFMGFRLFLARLTDPAGELSARAGAKTWLDLRKAAPGTFFVVLGASMIVVSFARGITASPLVVDIPAPPATESATKTEPATKPKSILMSFAGSLV